LLLSSLLLLPSLPISSSQAQSIFDVTKYGAKAGGSDINSALMSTWKKACASTSPSKVLIPSGTFLLSPVTLAGPCKAAIEVRVQGTLKALSGVGEMTKDGGWIAFQQIKGFTLSGGGIFDGQGAAAWGSCDNNNCKQLAINLRFDSITNGLVQDVTSLNSKQFHVNLLLCKNFTIRHLTVTAPADSKNTDGIHIGRSRGIKITDSKIGTGDDCISIGDGSQNVSITRVSCGPGHGISVGSLGKYENEEPVVGISVKGCKLTNTDNGLRIKTWPASFANSASNMHFEDITMVNVSNPIIIDQGYCPYGDCNAKAPSRVKISNVGFENIRGTSATPVGVKLDCSNSLPCEGVELINIDLNYIGKKGSIKSECSNVKPKVIGVYNALACDSTTSTTSKAPTKS
ncbi:exopolygalacturonase-like, partial [Pistacia vera]|uniref:exopolygalacturonase-like n=1 Tax=Pistacia vera TaxID=55513 RepID=UPI0012637089